ncbi:MFS transporter [Prescottella equi]|uniref:MFS transporter n=1 Tax=Rhodococcus hoagii TaxID=43767 RepID=UPI00384FA703
MALTTPSHPRLTTVKFTAGRAWTITILLLGFMLLNFADKAVLGFAGIQIMEDLSLSAQQFGLLQSAFFWLFAAGAIVIGALTTKVNVRWLLAAVMLVWIVTMLPLIGPVNFTVLLACRIVLGFAEGPAYALATHVVHSWFAPEKRALPAGIVTAGASIGPLIAAPVLTWVIVTWSWHAAFAVLVVAGVLWIVAWLLLGRDAPEASHDEGVDEQEDAPDRPVVVPYRRLLLCGTIIGIALLTFFAYWSTTLKISWLPLYLSDGLGYDTITTGRLITFPYAVAAVAAIGTGWLSNRLTARGWSKRFTRGYLTGGLVIGCGVSMFLFTVLDTGVAQMIFISLAFSLNSAAYAVAFVAIGDLVHPKQRGTVLGFLVAFYSMAGVLAPLLLGYFVDSAGERAIGYGHGFAVTGVLMTVGGLAAMFLVRPERDLARLRLSVEATR